MISCTQTESWSLSKCSKTSKMPLISFLIGADTDGHSSQQGFSNSYSCVCANSYTIHHSTACCGWCGCNCGWGAAATEPKVVVLTLAVVFHITGRTVPAATQFNAWARVPFVLGAHVFDLTSAILPLPPERWSGIDILLHFLNLFTVVSNLNFGVGAAWVV